jgi:protein TonB
MAENPTDRRIVKIVVGSLAAVVLIAAFISFVHKMLAAKSTKQERRVETVQIIRPPPPPPPDQPPPPPPEKTEEELPKDQPEPTPKDEEQAPPAALGLDAEGSAGGDAFGLAARHGGSDLIGGNGTAAFAWYTNRLKDAVLEHLTADPQIGSKRFSCAVRVWIEADGRIKEVKLVTSTGNHELDLRIEAALSSLSRLSDAPPLEMPQPVNLKIVSHA